MSAKQKSKTAKSRKPRPRPKKGKVQAPRSSVPDSVSSSPGTSDFNSTVRLVRELAAIVERRSLSELIIDSEDLTLTIRRGESAPMMQPSTTIVNTAPAAFPAHTVAAFETPPAAQPSAAPSSDEANGDHHLVKSPFVGTFYRRPNPESEEYVKVGDHVEKGTILCIVEAMKLMNEIEADSAGVISAILVEDANPVEYGQPMFKITPA